MLVAGESPLDWQNSMFVAPQAGDPMGSTVPWPSRVWPWAGVLLPASAGAVAVVWTLRVSPHTYCIIRSTRTSCWDSVSIVVLPRTWFMRDCGGAEQLGPCL
jgi:hypothetical protein